VEGVRLRPATSADDAFFVECEFSTTWLSIDEAERDAIGEAGVRAALQETHELLLSRAGNEIVIAETTAGERVGLLWFGVNRNLVTGREEAWVYNVTVVPAARGGGLGRRLMEHAEELARQRGFSHLGLMVSAHNAPARALYERLDFRATNFLMRKSV
jgi:ribosomal protein S18 acetylase RimI-like enzyme